MSRRYPAYCHSRRFFAPLLLLLLAVATVVSPARAQTPTWTMLHGFGRTEGDGVYPTSGLMQAADGALYGTTSSGGAANHGTLYKITTDGVLTIVHNFTGSPGGGASPVDGVIQAADGFLYGTTSDGGAKDYGTIYKIAPDGTGFTLLYSFDVGSGLSPGAALLEASDGFLYGTTQNSFLSQTQHGRIFAAGPGVLFRISRSGANFSVLHTLDRTASEGSDPSSALIQAADGALYGTAPGGGPFTSGVVFKYDMADPTSGAGGDGFSVRYAFSQAGEEGAGPVGGLLQGNDGFLYGTTAGGGAVLGQKGTVYRIGLDGASAPIVIHSFTGYPSEGEAPYGTLIQATDGAFYGTTTSGGLGSTGTVFKITADGVFTQLYAFADDGTDGSTPQDSLLQAADGNLYGTTLKGDPADPEVIYDFGTVFRLSGLLAPPAAALPLENATTRRVAFWYLGGTGDTTVDGSAYASAALPAGWEVVSGGADFNNDKRNDLLLQNLTTRQIAFWLMNGAVVTTGVNVAQPLPSGWRVRGAGDFNSDGKTDLILENPATRKIAFWLMNGSQLIGSAYANLSLPTGWQIAGVADNNGDGKADLVLENPAAQRVAVWLMNGTTVASGANASQALPSGWRVAGTGDFNHDGVASDLVLQNSGTRKIALWYLQGAIVGSGAYVDTALPANWEVAAPN